MFHFSNEGHFKSFPNSRLFKIMFTQHQFTSVSDAPKVAYHTKSSIYRVLKISVSCCFIVPSKRQTHEENRILFHLFRSSAFQFLLPYCLFLLVLWELSQYLCIKSLLIQCETSFIVYYCLPSAYSLEEFLITYFYIQLFFPFSSMFTYRIFFHHIFQ